MTTSPLSVRIARRVRREYNKRRIARLALKWPLPETSLDAFLPGHSVVKSPLLEDICMPPYFGVDDHDDYTPLMHIAVRLQPSRVIELGTAHGNTIANLCRHCPGAAFITVNAPFDMQTGDVVTFELKPDEIGRVFRNAGFASRVTQIFANTLHLDLTQHLERETAELGIVDACHDEPFVLNDFLKLVPYIRRNGVILLHDTHPSMEEHLKGSYVACLRLRKMGYDIRHLAGTWWGAWRNV